MFGKCECDIEPRLFTRFFATG